jgi:NADH-quinone oxidoreductase subunit N
MNRAELLALSPLLVLAASIIVVMLLAAFYRRHGVVMWASQLGLLLSLASLAVALPHAGRQVTTLLVVDGYSLFFSALLLLASLAVNTLAHDYLRRCSRSPEEFYILLPLAALGALVLVSSRHFAALFIGLELLSVSLFGLIAYTSRRWRAIEAGLKYLILAGISSAILLFGMALVYAELGTLTFSGLSRAIAANGVHNAMLLAGVALTLAGIGFKLSLVPFHMWVADIYEGAPAPVGAFLATVSKGAVFVLLLRYLPQADLSHAPSLLVAMSVLAIGSMLAGNLLALLQDNLKRLLGYSSVAHFGYLLVLLVAGGNLAIEAAGYYLAAYFLSMLGPFGVISLLSDDQREEENLADLQGLFWRHPWLAGVLGLSLLSLAGIPVSMGFVAKFYLLAVGVEQARWLLVASMILASTIGLYYYLRVIIQLFHQPAEAPLPRPRPFPLGAGVVMLGTGLLLLLLGIYPAPLINLLHLHALLPL